MTSSNAILTVQSSPEIIVQPTNQAIAVGSNATFIVTAIGTVPLHYQWQMDGTNLVNEGHGGHAGQISGATTNVLTISNAQTNNSGNYSVIVTNIAGSVTSSNARLDGDEYPAGDHGATDEPDERGGIDCDLGGHRHRDGAVELPMADERDEPGEEWMAASVARPAMC